MDFKFSATHSLRACLELKLSSHKKLKQGLTSQLLWYMRPQGIKIGIFVVIVFDEKDKEKVKQLENEKDALEEKHGISVDFISIDATQHKVPPSQSKSPIA